MKKLIEQWIDAKRVEKESESARVALGDQISKALNYSTEGSKTFDVDGYKVKVKCVVNRKVDLTAISSLNLSTIPIKTTIKKEIDMDGLRWFEANDPKNYQRILTTITATPGRTIIEVEEKASEK